MATLICTKQDCKQQVAARSLCTKHYQQDRRSGALKPKWNIKDTSKMGNHVPKTAFKKGHDTWSKGMKGWVSEKHKAAIKKANTGRTPWNKGLLGIMPTPQNKIGDGITAASKLERTKFRKTTQKLVFQRDDYTCQICLVRGGNLQVDHIKRWADYPELRFELDNCRTLCMGCHYFVTFKRKIPSGVIWGHNLSRRIAS